MDRRSKENYYLDIADAALNRSTCLRRKYGAIVVREDEILSTGYNGAPRGRRNCSDLGYCAREKLNIPRGERYELCRSVHAEANAIISAARRDMLGGTLYLVGRDARSGELLKDATPCAMCRRLIINAGIAKVVARVGEDQYESTDVNEWIEHDETIDLA
ncbi:MAG: cytidine deaminase [Ruminococcaceae bacterium]|nr:cytidine deaminase [Oscillospiraceae bacterium]